MQFQVTQFLTLNEAMSIPPVLLEVGDSMSKMEKGQIGSGTQYQLTFLWEIYLALSPCLGTTDLRAKWYSEQILIAVQLAIL
jgi:hypothetical protein